jgi:hypothetical protein
MKLRSNIALFSVLTLSLAGANVSANTWGTYHWARKSNPMVIKVVDSVTPEWDTAFLTTLQEWSFSPMLDLALVSADDSLTTRQNCPMIQGQIRVCNYTYGETGWLGLATIGVDANGHIDKGRARLNDSYSYYWSMAGERNHVMCQEVGHLFGLDHSTTDGSSQATCMDYSTDISSQWPNGEDFDSLLGIYTNHTDSYNSYYVTPTTTTGGATTAPTTTCVPKGKKRCPTAASAAAESDANMGIKIGSNGKKEMWVAHRADGGIYIHVLYMIDGHHEDEEHSH